MADIEKYLTKAQEQHDRDEFKKICKAFTESEWAVVLSVMPSKVIARELVRRAELGAQALDKMKEAYDSVWN